jgi:hypothetical protein
MNIWSANGPNLPPVASQVGEPAERESPYGSHSAGGVRSTSGGTVSLALRCAAR